MVNDKQLILGAFYWVIPKPDAERDDDWLPGVGWQNEIQPARFAGWNAAGEMLWNFMGVDGSRQLVDAVDRRGDQSADRGGASEDYADAEKPARGWPIRSLSSM